MGYWGWAVICVGREHLNTFLSEDAEGHGEHLNTFLSAEDAEGQDLQDFGGFWGWEGRRELASARMSAVREITSV